MFSNVLSIRGRIALSNFVGMGSKIQVVGLEHEIIFGQLIKGDQREAF